MARGRRTRERKPDDRPSAANTDTPPPVEAQKSGDASQALRDEALLAATPAPDPADGDMREQMMQRDVLLVATAGVSLVNGQGFSPLFDPVFFLLRPFLAGAFYAMPMVAFYLTSIFISLMTLLIAGIPAALYERHRGLQESSPVSIGIWLAATIILCLPALKAGIGAG